MPYLLEALTRLHMVLEEVVRQRSHMRSVFMFLNQTHDLAQITCLIAIHPGHVFGFDQIKVSLLDWTVSEPGCRSAA